MNARSRAQSGGIACRAEINSHDAAAGSLPSHSPALQPRKSHPSIPRRPAPCPLMTGDSDFDAHEDATASSPRYCAPAGASPEDTGARQRRARGCDG